MNDIITAARDLGKRIASHPRTQAFTRSAKAISEDREAQQVLRDYQVHVQHIQQLEHDGKPIEVADKRKLADLEGHMAGNDRLKDLMKHQANYLEMMDRVNQAIDEAGSEKVSG